MYEIKQKLNDLIDICLKRIEKTEEEKAAYISKSSVADAQKLENDKKALGLDEREEKCKEIEALGLSADSLKAKHEQVDAMKAQLIADREKMQEEYNAKEKSLIEREGTVKLLTDKVNAEREQIEKDKKKYKSDVMETINAELKAKGLAV